MTTHQTALTWRKSSFSTGDTNGGECVEVAVRPDGGVLLRNSQLGDASPVVAYTRAEISAFLRGVHAGEFDDLI
jgi:hypothetical protein